MLELLEETRVIYQKGIPNTMEIDRMNLVTWWIGEVTDAKDDRAEQNNDQERKIAQQEPEKKTKRMTERNAKEDTGVQIVCHVKSRNSANNLVR